ncbi:MAG: UvrD-helicase domain-containing protein [Bacteroidetes bacterium]|nr:UvrD-helicase domain-containing protein [Bacteroidota bacterium]
MSNFVVYKAGAGSGKTFTLVKEYLKLALHDETKLSFNYKKILALTFTNKAAAEMKQRVIDALNNIITQDPLPFIGQAICEEIHLTSAEIKKRAKFLLSHILHNYSDFSIGTIDSFTHKIVKTFAYDLQLPVNFNLETDVAGFYQKVVSDLFARLGEDEYLTKLLKSYSFNRAEDNSSWDPEKQILDFVKLLEKENAATYLNQLSCFSTDELENFRKEFFEYIAYYTSALKTLATEAIEFTKQQQLAFNDFWHAKNGPVNFFYKCFENSVKLEDINAPRLSEALAKNKWLKDNSHPNGAEINERLSTIALQLTEFIGSNNRHFLLCELLLKQIYPLMLIKKLEEISRDKKTEEQIVFISEFNKKIFDLINNEPTPFIYERLGEKYRHYLLDEFQDTSGLQWHNILPLLDNSLANGWFNLIVGDGKQSIYRWRSANVKQFSNLPEIEHADHSPILSERRDSLQRNFKKEILGINYRSVKTIVEFNNDLFHTLNKELLTGSFAAIYDDHTQKIKNESEGYVTIKTGKTSKEGLEELNFEQIKEYVSQAIASGYSYNEICIICRFNYQGSLIASHLMENNIPVVSSDSLLLKNNLEVNTIINFLNYLNNKEDQVRATAVIDYLYQSGQISNEQFNAAAKDLGARNTLFETLRTCGILINENDFLLSNLFDNCIQIVNALGLNKTAPLYIRFFLDEVNEYLVTKNSNLSQFLHVWESRSSKASLIIPDNTNAVKIMTIHASKGLEFPVVIIPYCNWAQYKANESWVNINDEKISLPVAVVSLTEKIKNAGLEAELELEKQEQTLDNLNLLYVAFTRAVDRLHIISAFSETIKQQLVNEWLEKYLIDKHGANPENFYELGSKQNKVNMHPTKQLAPYTLLPLSFSTNTSSIQIKSDYLNNNLESENAKRQGIIFHWILSKIKHRSDLDGTLQSALMEGYITSLETLPIKHKLIEILEHPTLNKYFQKETHSKVEAELITSNGEVFRPDKLVFTENEIVIIDYKTGKQNHKKYYDQMIRYENAIKSLGHSNIKKILVYIDPLEIAEL